MILVYRVYIQQHRECCVLQHIDITHKIRVDRWGAPYSKTVLVFERRYFGVWAGKISDRDSASQGPCPLLGWHLDDRSRARGWWREGIEPTLLPDKFRRPVHGIG